MYMTDLIFRSQDTFIPELNDSNSPAFKERVLLVIAEIEPIYKKKYPSSFIRVLVKRFSYCYYDCSCFNFDCGCFNYIFKWIKD
ncbi:hypothetical protein F2P79_007956 [Pimephales promelas]|nr:hypothetical protein F2P79_007956 [Pimephales promelas]